MGVYKEAYKETVDDIRNTIGILPKFMKDLPEDELVDDWAFWKYDELHAHKWE
ncbi:MAG: hypothetical protein PWR29_1645 [Methanolobus sp.]|jgi:hypothetical protein|nr:hypothetical protein [Methanolobus sp.]MDK2835105.1 hypothetical protein [Methanolobus sp.]MDK2912688.1 hypothetical protein [Methanolobus sp.]MDN5310510.1 hypothetical protein [Methanolobus sp.]